MSSSSSPDFGNAAMKTPTSASKSTSKKRQHQRKRSSWSGDNEKLLVEVWAEHITDLRGTRKNTHVYDEMRVAMERYGCVFTGAEIRTKINNLSSRYRKEKSTVGVSGGSPSAWPLYQGIHAILGGFSINNVRELTDESADQPYEGVEYLEDSMVSWSSTQRSITPPAPSAGRSKKLFHDRIIEKMTNMEVQISNQTEYLKEYDDKVFGLMQTFVQDSKEMKDAFVKYCEHAVRRNP